MPLKPALVKPIGVSIGELKMEEKIDIECPK